MQHPAKKQRKRISRRMIALLTMIALAAAAALVLLLPAILERFPAQRIPYEQKQSTVRTIDTRDSAQLACVTIYPDGQNGYTLEMQDGTLMLALGEDRIAIAEDYQTEILNAVTQISVQDVVAENEADVSQHLEAMGLTDPQCRAVARYADGHEETFEIGAQVYNGTDYYFRWSGAEGVYTCHSGLLETFSLTEKLLIPFESPSVYGSLLEGIKLSNANGTISVRFENGASGRLTEPCAYPLDDDAAQTLMTAAENIRLGAYEAPLTDDNRAAYGFDDPLCSIEVTQGEGTASVVGEDGTLQTAVAPAQTLHFVIGREEGDFFYTCAYQNDVYLVSRFLLETLVSADWQSMLSRTPANMGDVSLSRIVFETQQDVVEMDVERTQSVLPNNELETDSEGNIVYNTTVAVNGQSAPVEKLETLLERLNAFTVEGEIPPDAQLSEQPRWRIALVAETGETRVLEGYRMDVFSDAVAVDGVMRHYVYDEAIDVLMAGLL